MVEADADELRQVLGLEPDRQPAPVDRRVATLPMRMQVTRSPCLKA